ncbi:MAG: mannose-1-phosphate guanylyltransferase/mannose-6-phosphate isomerase [Deltaproteobacteria bacterium]|jgi:mannose-1-phosphate guanylyltransferase/mannose-6-phosphate isomerase|nr:mannose-1-phosphate guanylyltransferase/mannose-6-phosphate isomerase [Deltaproteobacteria bacterium]
METLVPLIVSGGSGTRLWPLSRGLYPKQFMDINGRTLFGQTLARVSALPDCAPPLVICNEEHRFLAAAILRDELGQEARQASILLEPAGRNTAPAVALGALAACAQGDDPLLLVLPADHLIEPAQAFAQAVTLAVQGAQHDLLAVFGVLPVRPETGYGYIRSGPEILPGIFEVSRFVEKPSPRSAEEMLAQGGYFWNSGMFLFRASVFLRELAAFTPAAHQACLAIWQERRQDPDFLRFSPEAFARCPSVSVDYAVMEHTRSACMIPLTASWRDMGSWEAFHDAGTKDAEGNVLVGDVLCHDVADSYLHASHRLLTAVGVRGLSVVETADAVLVAGRGSGQEIKILLEALKDRGRPETDTHLRVHRPWGFYETLVRGERFQVKRILVNPGASLSLQMHYHRAEHWVVTRGTARVNLDDAAVVLKEDMSSYIPVGMRHRLENPGRIPLEIIEIQTGSYLGEDDIVRFEDDYGRS